MVFTEESSIFMVFESRIWTILLSWTQTEVWNIRFSVSENTQEDLLLITCINFPSFNCKNKWMFPLQISIRAFNRRAFASLFPIVICLFVSIYRQFPAASTEKYVYVCWIYRRSIMNYSLVCTTELYVVSMINLLLFILFPDILGWT